MKFSETIKKIILLIGDIAVFYISLAVALAARNGSFSTDIFWQHFWPFTVVLVIWLVVFFSFNLYDIFFFRSYLDFLGNAVKTMAINIMAAIIFFYLASTLLITPKTILAIQAVVFFFTFGVFRYFANLFFGLASKNNTLCVGSVEQFEDIIKEVSSKPQLGYEIKTLLDIDQEHALHEQASETLCGIYSIKIIPNHTDIKDLVLNEKIDTVIIEPLMYDSRDIIQKLYECLPYDIEIISLATFSEKMLKKIPLGSISQTWLLENIASGKHSFYEAMKRVADIICALIGSVFFGIIWIFVAIAIKLDDRGPVFYKQTRIGKNGKTFDMLKFRTMRTDAEKNGPQWAGDNDPRITKVGHFLRRTRLDEVPQIVNILRGEMSVVGPRAEQPKFCEMFIKQIPFYKERLLIKPGLTGWAQVNYLYAANVEENKRKLQYDLYYLKNKSFLLDLAIIFKTVSIVLRGSGK